MVDQKGLTALDTVKDMPSKKSRQIAALILGEPTSTLAPTLTEAPIDTLSKSVKISCLSVTGHMTGKPPDIDLPPPPVPPPQESPSLRKKSKKCQMLEVFDCQMFWGFWSCEATRVASEASHDIHWPSETSADLQITLNTNWKIYILAAS